MLNFCGTEFTLAFDSSVQYAFLPGSRRQCTWNVLSTSVDESLPRISGILPELD